MLDKKFKSYYLLSLVYQLGVSIIIPIVIGIFGGIFLDKKFDSKPLFTLIGIFLGLIFSAVGVYL